MTEKLAMKKEYNSTHPVYLQGRALSEIAQAIAQYIDLQYEHLRTSGHAPLHIEIAEAMRQDSDLIQQNATAVSRSRSIRKSARRVGFLRTLSKNLLSYCNGLEHHGLKESEYLHLLREEIRIYRRALRQWMASMN